MSDSASDGPAGGSAGSSDAGSGPFVVEPMRRRHLRQVLRIEAQRGETGWSLGLFMGELSRPDDRAYLVARDPSDGSVVGFAGGLLVIDDLHVTTVAVHPRARRRGVATVLMVELVRRGVDAGMTNATLEVRASNTAAIELYRRFGFAPVGTRSGYYRRPDGTTEDALVLWATDIAGVDYAHRLARLEAEVAAAGWRPGDQTGDGPDGPGTGGRSRSTK